MAKARDVLVGPPLVGVCPSLKSRAASCKAKSLIFRMLIDDVDID